MPFSGPDPYGTPGGNDDLDKPQTPDDVRIAKGGSYIAFLVINGPLTVRNRSAIEQIVRTLGSRGEYSMALVIQDNGGNIDVAANTLDFGAGIRAVQVSPGIVRIDIPDGGITEGMIPDTITRDSEMNAAISRAFTSMHGPFTRFDLPAGLNNNLMFMSITAGTLTIPMPAAGSIIGYSAVMFGAATAGTISIGARGNAGDPVIQLTTLVAGETTRAEMITTPIPFNTGAFPRSSVSTSSDLAPAGTLDLVVYLLIRLNL